MGRPLRIEFPGAVYHVTSRGDRRESIFRDAADRRLLLDIVDSSMRRLDAEMLAFCLMGNHYHFVLQTRQANLSRLMRHVNGVYSQAFNRRHGLVGHLFQGRFKAIHVDQEAYFMEVSRYVELNPAEGATSLQCDILLDPGRRSRDPGAPVVGTVRGRPARAHRPRSPLTNRPRARAKGSRWMR